VTPESSGILGQAPVYGRALNRRTFIRTSAAGALAAAVGLPLLSACGAIGPQPGPAAAGQPAGGASGTAVGQPAGPFPTYVPQQGGPTADYHGGNGRVTDGFEHFPKDPFKSWNKPAPGAGSTVNVFINAYYPLPTPYEQNPTWQEINKQLNANVQMSMVTGADYPTKMATVMSSNDLPDIMHIFAGVPLSVIPSLPDFFKAKCADLTPYLAGDAIKDYPNLAAIPTYAWKNSLCTIDHTVYSWPIHRYLPGVNFFFKNADIYDKAIGADYVPKDADDFMRVLRELNHPEANQWAIGNEAAAARNMGILGYAQMFGAPNTWGRDANGKLVRDRETEQYKAAVGYVRDVWATGLMWPNAPTSPQARPDFSAGRFAISVEGFGNSWNDFWRRGLQNSPQQHFDLIKPFRASAGDPPIAFLSGGYISTNVMKKASPDRIKELLRIADWLAAPFGSQEDLLLSYGVAGADYSIDANGDPNLTPDGVNRAGYVPWRYISQHPYVQYQADLPGYTKRSFDAEQLLVGQGVEDVTLGYYSKTDRAGTGGKANQAFVDGQRDIILGRRPLSDYDQVVQEWRSTAGDQIRQEFQTAMEANG
jgi:putative aldouronate transport system substrate-binding protein